MKPRGYIATMMVLAARRGLPFGLAWSLFFALCTKTAFGEVFWPVGFGGGVLFGFLAGAIFAIKFRAAAVTLPVGPDRDAFLTRATLGLAVIGYHPEQPIGNAYTFRPSYYVDSAAGRITLVVERASSDATILGPVVHVRKLRELLAKEQPLAGFLYRE